MPGGGRPDRLHGLTCRWRWPIIRRRLRSERPKLSPISAFHATRIPHEIPSQGNYAVRLLHEPPQRYKKQDGSLAHYAEWIPHNQSAAYIYRQVGKDVTFC